MKALLISGNQLSSRILRRLLGDLGVSVSEAKDGLFGLVALEEDDPDFILMNVSAPVMDALHTLRAIRNSSTRREIPVMCVSDSVTQEVANELVELRIADFVLRPFRLGDMTRRLRRLMARASEWRERLAGGLSQSVLVVDGDPNFREFLRGVLGSRFEVLEAPTGPRGMIEFSRVHPSPGIVLVQENLPLFGEHLLAGMLKKIAEEAGTAPPRIFLVPQSEPVAPEKAAMFEGVIPRTFLPDKFQEDFFRIVRNEDTFTQRLVRALLGDLCPEITSAVQQTFGVMASSAVEIARPDHTVEAAAEVGVQLVLRSDDHGVAVRIAVSGGRTEIQAVASIISKGGAAAEDGGAEALREIVNVIAGRIRSSLRSRELELTMGQPEALADGAGDFPAAEAELSQYFRRAGGQWLHLMVRVEKAGATAGAASAPAIASGPSSASGRPPRPPEAQPPEEEILKAA